MSDPATAPAASNYFGEHAPAHAIDPRSAGLVRHVPIVALLMIAQGLLELLLALFFGGTSIFMLSMPTVMPQGGSPRMVAAMLGAMAAVVLGCGVFRIIAAVPLYQLRGRKLAVVSLLAGLLVVSSGYCIPTATALAVYGLVVLFDERVIASCDQGK